MPQIGAPVIPFWSLPKKSPATQNIINPVVATVKKPVMMSGDVINDITSKSTSVEKSASDKPPLSIISNHLISPSPQEADKNKAQDHDFEEVFKDLLEKRNLTAQMMQLFSNSPSLCEDSGSCVDEFAEKLKQMDRAIALVNRSVELLKSSVDVPVQTPQVITLEYDDVPKCFFIGQSNSHFKNAKWYENIRDFVTMFEYVVAASNQDVELVWKQYILMSFSRELKHWVHTRIVTCASWSEAKQILCNKFGSASSRLHARRKLMNIKMEKDENLDVYTARFTYTVHLAGYTNSDQAMADAFLFGLPNSWQSRINNYLMIRMDNTDWKVEDVRNAVISVYGKIPYNQYNKGFQDSTSSKVKVKRKLRDPQAIKKSKKTAKKKKTG